MIAWLTKTSFKKAILRIFMTMISTLPIGTYSAEYVEIGYRNDLVIEASVNVANIIYMVGERGEDFYSYGGGLGYKGDNYGGLVAISQIVGDITQYKAELQGTYNDGAFIVFAALAAHTEESGIMYKLGAGYPVNEKLSISTYVSSKGFFIGFRRSL